MEICAQRYLWAASLIVVSTVLAGCNETVAEPAHAAVPEESTSTNNAPAEVALAQHAAPADDSQETDANGSTRPSEETPVESIPAAFAELDSTQSFSSATTAVPGTVEVASATVEAIDAVEVPAQEAGVIRALAATEGDSVAEGDELGKVDDDRAQIELQLAEIEYASSKEQAENDINVKYAIAAAGVAKYEYEKAVLANEKAEGAFSDVELKELALVHKRSVYQIDQARLELKIAGMTMSANESRVNAAKKSVARRQIIATRTGVVVKLYKHVGEWADPGEAVLRLVRSDKMRVEGYMNARDYDPHTVAGKQARVTVELARGREVEFSGVVKLPDLTIEADGKYRIWVEVKNQREGDAWLLRPGQRAKMTITVE